VFSLTKIYSKYIKNVGIKIASFKSMFQYKSNDTNFTQYNQVLVALFIRLKFFFGLHVRPVTTVSPERDVLIVAVDAI
jgi:hypothetical protein